MVGLGFGKKWYTGDPPLILEGRKKFGLRILCGYKPLSTTTVHGDLTVHPLHMHGCSKLLKSWE